MICHGNARKKKRSSHLSLLLLLQSQTFLQKRKKADSTEGQTLEVMEEVAK